MRLMMRMSPSKKAEAQPTNYKRKSHKYGVVAALITAFPEPSHVSSCDIVPMQRAPVTDLMVLKKNSALNLQKSFNSYYGELALTSADMFLKRKVL